MTTSTTTSVTTSATTPATSTTPQVAVIMGSSSDWETMAPAVTVLESFGVSVQTKVISAHRMPHDMVQFAAQASQQGLRAIIAGAGGAAHLPGMMAALTEVPVFWGACC